MEEIRYSIEFTPEVVKNLPNLPKTMRLRILKAIDERLSYSPLDFGKPLKYNLKGFRRIRVGDYRIIYQVIEEKIIVLIIEIDHRKDVYE